VKAKIPQLLLITIVNVIILENPLPRVPVTVMVYVSTLAISDVCQLKVRVEPTRVIKAVAPAPDALTTENV
jgi:hypothetical protein